MKKEWQILQPDIHLVDKLSRTLKCHPAIASILVNRKIFSLEDASTFLNATLNHLRPPFSIKDIETAVERILRAIKNKEKILIFGDYDVDGITATAILLEFFNLVHADVSYYIPHRIKEGFGLRTNHISNYAAPNGVKLIITVDCGSDSQDAVNAAKKAGIDVIITDHHIISDRIPPAVAVVNPKRNDCPSGLCDLAGVGVAFYLLICLRKALRDINFWQDRPEPNLKKYCNLVAIGTLADMVPLTRVNRILTRAGLNIIRSTHQPGLNALMEICKINRHSVDTNDIIFGLVPRLNAAGRIEHASKSVELLMTQSVKTARKIAYTLNHMNSRRRNIEDEILAQIQNHLNNNPNLLRKNSLVLVHQGWHLGVLGIVASRVVKKYFRPVVLITTEDGIGRGSARSIPDINLYAGLNACKDQIENFGGHSMAAGLKIKSENIEQFKVNFENVISRKQKRSDFIPKISIDYSIDFDDISDKLVDELESLQPFGMENQEPLFMTRDVRIVSSKLVGKNHRRMVLNQISAGSKKTLDAIQFNVDTSILLQEKFAQIAFRLRWNRWNGRKTVQIVIEAT